MNGRLRIDCAFALIPKQLLQLLHAVPRGELHERLVLVFARAT